MLDTFLPVVKPEVAASLHREIFDKFDVPYIKNQLARLDEDNPVIGRWIMEFGKTTDDKVGAMYCGIMVYRLLESQAEANRMAEEIKLGD
jgi:hypothetical protein